MNEQGALTRFATGSGPMLLDFDGPICSVFAEYPAAEIAGKMIAVAGRLGVTNTTEIPDSSDPIEIVRWAGKLHSPVVLHDIERVLRTAELTAVASAHPTPHASDVIIGMHALDRKVAIVSNNSSPAIASYLRKHQLDQYVATIIGRPCGKPEDMKPAATLIHAATKALDAEPADCLFVGDSTSDIEAGLAAGTSVIGYANKPGKAERLSHADQVITSMKSLVIHP